MGGKKVIKSHQDGFTLIELMIVVAIIGILAAIAVPGYYRYVLRSHRVDARNMLQSAAQRLQASYSANLTYVTGKSLEDWGYSRSPAKGTIRYNISYVGGAPKAQGFTLQAIPQGAQSKDECGTFTINQSGAKTANGAGVRDEISINCWRK